MRYASGCISVIELSGSGMRRRNCCRWRGIAELLELDRLSGCLGKEQDDADAPVAGVFRVLFD